MAKLQLKILLKKIVQLINVKFFLLQYVSYNSMNISRVISLFL